MDDSQSLTLFEMPAAPPVIDTIAEVENALSDQEQVEFGRYEAVIKRGIETFVSVGNALLGIRRDQLYRGTHSTFEAYCEQRWQMTHDYARKLIGAAEVVGNLKSNTIVSLLPATESQARPLTKLEPEQQVEVWQEAVATAPNGKVTAAHVEMIAEKIKARPHVTHNSGNNEWYTPPDHIEAARLTLGVIELDPASSEEANAVVRAVTYYTIEDDGLSQTWRGKVWMNPPYVAGLVDRFLEKLIFHFERQEVQEAIVLVNNATETQWFQSLARHAAAICFPARRIKYWTPNVGVGAPLQGQAILYLGSDPMTFAENFSYFGIIAKPIW